MFWFWVGFFTLISLLLLLDLAVLHRKNETQSMRSAALWTIGWVALGLSFAAVVYVIYQRRTGDGANAAATYVSAYLLEQTLSVDNLFVIAFTFSQFKVPPPFQHRVLFWGLLGAVVFRVAMLGGGVWLANQFEWVFYVFGAWLAYKGAELLLELLGRVQKGNGKQPWLTRALRRVLPVEDDHAGRFFVRTNHRRVITTLALCLVTIELQDIGFSLDSIPAVLSVSNDSFIVITSNIFAILGLRSLYFVLSGMMMKFKYLELALGVLLIGIGVKLALHGYVHVTQLQSLIAIGAVLTAGVVASVMTTSRR